jgi:hypothetical protein
MFQKISNTFLDMPNDWSKFKSNIKVSGYYSEKRDGGSAFYTITNYLLFHKLHRKNIFTIKPSIYFCEFTGSGLVTPHTDVKDTVALNFYLSSTIDATIFYTPNEGAVTIPNTQSYRVDQVNEVARFSARQFDAYVLDVTKIHAIDKTDDSVRSMISYRWQGPSYEEILNSLNVELE